jgi:dihydroxyacid dehydratase/phosphogluconate dehydratase
VVCSAIEIVSKINNFDGLVTLSSCDDILAGSLMGVGRVNIPAVMVTGGPMMPGCYRGEKVLAPDIAIIRPSGVPAGMKAFRGTARVFEDEDRAIAAMKDGHIKSGDVIVLRYMGPKGAPGMTYAQASCQALVGLGLHKSDGLVTDGRFSGFNHGPIVGHVSPEAFEGGPLALVRENDCICVDVDDRSLQVDLTAEEFADRKSQWRQPELKVKSGWLALYAANCCSASQGAAIVQRNSETTFSAFFKSQYSLFPFVIGCWTFDVRCSFLLLSGLTPAYPNVGRPSHCILFTAVAVIQQLHLDVVCGEDAFQFDELWLWGNEGAAFFACFEIHIPDVVF